MLIVLYGRGADELKYYITRRGILVALYLIEDKAILTLFVIAQSSVYSPLEHTVCITTSDALTFSFVLYGSPNKEVFLLYASLSHWLL